jgi:hypothetical protein
VLYGKDPGHESRPGLFASIAAGCTRGVKLNKITAAQRHLFVSTKAHDASWISRSRLGTIGYCRAAGSERVGRDRRSIARPRSNSGTIPSVKRHLFNLAAGVSLLFCAASMLLWPRSYTHDDSIGLSSGRVLFAYEGKLWFQIDDGWPDLKDPTWGSHYKISIAGFGFQAGTLRQFYGDAISATYSKQWFIPIWFVVLACGVLPVLWILRTKPRKFTGGFCITCGYDLRATPDRCPECGTVPKTKLISS